MVKPGRGGAYMKKLTTERDCHEWKLTRKEQLAIYLKEGPLMWMMHLHVNHKSY